MFSVNTSKFANYTSIQIYALVNYITTQLFSLVSAIYNYLSILEGELSNCTPCELCKCKYTSILHPLKAYKSTPSYLLIFRASYSYLSCVMFQVRLGYICFTSMFLYPSVKVLYLQEQKPRQQSLEFTCDRNCMLQNISE